MLLTTLHRSCYNCNSDVLLSWNIFPFSIPAVLHDHVPPYVESCSITATNKWLTVTQTIKQFHWLTAKWLSSDWTHWARPVQLAISHLEDEKIYTLTQKHLQKPQNCPSQRDEIFSYINPTQIHHAYQAVTSLSSKQTGHFPYTWWIKIQKIFKWHLLWTVSK